MNEPLKPMAQIEESYAEIVKLLPELLRLINSIETGIVAGVPIIMQTAPDQIAQLELTYQHALHTLDEILKFKISKLNESILNKTNGASFTFKLGQNRGS